MVIHYGAVHRQWYNCTNAATLLMFMTIFVHRLHRYGVCVHLSHTKNHAVTLFNNGMEKLFIHYRDNNMKIFTKLKKAKY